MCGAGGRVFVGRQSELGYVRAWLTEPCPRSGLLAIDGPIGIGKSTLLSEILRLARQHGAAVAHINGATELGELIRPIHMIHRAGRRIVVTIDDYETVDGKPLLARHPLADVPQVGVLMAIASRQMLSRAWLADAVMRERTRSMSLAPLTPAEAREYVAHVHAALDSRTRDVIVQRARGLPLALAAAAWALEKHSAPMSSDAGGDDWIEELRDALGILDFPMRLSGTPLARRLGRSGPELRLLLQEGLSAHPPRAPMSQEDQHILRAAFRERAERPEEMAARLFVSRSTYYRRVRVALERFAAALVSDRSPAARTRLSRAHRLTDT